MNGTKSFEALFCSCENSYCDKWNQTFDREDPGDRYLDEYYSIGNINKCNGLVPEIFYNSTPLKYELLKEDDVNQILQYEICNCDKSYCVTDYFDVSNSAGLTYE